MGAESAHALRFMPKGGVNPFPIFPPLYTVAVANKCGI